MHPGEVDLGFPHPEDHTGVPQGLGRMQGWGRHLTTDLLRGLLMGIHRFLWATQQAAA
jgi:hypothetical protein